MYKCAYEKPIWHCSGSLLQQMVSGERKAVSQRVSKNLLSLYRRSSWRCLVRSGSAHSAPCSAFHCQHQSHTDYGFDSCSLAQSLSFTKAEISALQNSQHGNSFITTSAVSGIFSLMLYNSNHGAEKSKIHLLHMESLRIRLFSICPLSDAFFLTLKHLGF